MNKFLNVYNNFMKIITESSNKYDNIPRPERFKTPPNEYGSNGYNAKYYNLYIQDEACAVFQDKYGEVKGEQAWHKIIGIGNAMWKACDEILGERHTMEDIINTFFDEHKEIYDKCADSKDFLFQDFYRGFYIVDWTWWILIQMIEGKRFTNDFISTCIPTFKGVLKKAPVTTAVLLEEAGIDIENFQISKKIQSRIDTVNAEKERIKKEEEEKNRIEQERIAKREQVRSDLKNQISKYYDDKDDINKLAYRLLTYAGEEAGIDVSVGYDKLYKLPEPTNKDEQRIYDIVKRANEIPANPKLKSDKVQGDVGIYLNTNFPLIGQLATNMNNKITDEEKRKAREAAAEKYGVCVGFFK